MAVVYLLLLLAPIALLYIWSSEKDAEKKRLADETARRLKEVNDRLIAGITHIVKYEDVRGFRTSEEICWIQVDGSHRSDIESRMKLKAAKAGANAIVKLRSNTERETYQAGTGPKGNPYYKSRSVTTWEGQAVRIEPIQSRKKVKISDASNANASYYPTILNSCGLAILDGSNIAHWTGEFDFDTVSKVYREVHLSGTDVEIFFDANIGHKVAGRHLSEAEIAKRVGVDPTIINLAPGGQQADLFILTFAKRKGAVVVSNDRYRDNPSLSDGVPLLAGKVVKGEVLFGEISQ